MRTRGEENAQKRSTRSSGLATPQRTSSSRSKTPIKKQQQPVKATKNVTRQNTVATAKSNVKPAFKGSKGATAATKPQQKVVTQQKVQIDKKKLVTTKAAGRVREVEASPPIVHRGRGRPPRVAAAPSTSEESEDDTTVQQQSSGEEEDLSGVRSGRKRIVPARFRDSPSPPPIRRRRKSSTSQQSSNVGGRSSSSSTPAAVSASSVVGTTSSSSSILPLSTSAVVHQIKKKPSISILTKSISAVQPKAEQIDEQLMMIDSAHYYSSPDEHLDIKNGCSISDSSADLPKSLIPLMIVDDEPRRPCKVCGKSLKVSNMKQHLMTHTGIRPFKCEICQAVFTRRSDVFRHVKIIHHQEKAFKCSKCGKEFSDKKGLKVHMVQHKKPSLFACKVCDFKFGKFEYYLNHIKFIHPTGEPLPEFPEDVEPAPEPAAPPQGRYGPTPLMMDDESCSDDDGRVESIQGIGGSSSVGLESIETEEIPHHAEMQLVRDTTLDVHEGVKEEIVVTHHHEEELDVQQEVETTLGNVKQDVDKDDDERDKNKSSQDVEKEQESQEQINFPSLEDDAAAILGMTDAALTNENTSFNLDTPSSLDTDGGGSINLPMVVSSSSALPKSSESSVMSSTVKTSTPRVVTIGKPLMTTGGTPRTILLAKPRAGGGKPQLLQTVKLGPRQRIVATRGARPIIIQSSGSTKKVLSGGHQRLGGPRSPLVRQVIINRNSSLSASRMSVPRVVRPSVQRQPLHVVANRPITTSSTSSSLMDQPHVIKTATPAVPKVSPIKPTSPRPSTISQQPSTQLTTVETAPKNIELTTSTSGGQQRTIILQTSGGGSDILKSEEAMQTLLAAVQQLVSASGDTLEGKQIEIVMQNDQAGSAAGGAGTEPTSATPTTAATEELSE